jgi:hypothetical protein
MFGLYLFLAQQQQAEMLDVKDGTQKLKDISPSLLKQSQLDVQNKENTMGSTKKVRAKARIRRNSSKRNESRRLCLWICCCHTKTTAIFKTFSPS